MTSRRLDQGGEQRTRYRGTVDFLVPDGGHFLAQCDARLTRERWQGTLTIPDFTRRLERGDVCRVSCERLGELRVIILDHVGTNRYDFIALVKPDPLEIL